MTIDRSLDQADIAALRTAVRGQVHRPTDAGYALASHNVAVSLRPWAVVDVADADDIAAVIGFAAAAGMTVAVHATGHGATGVDGHSIVVRTGALDVCEVDPVARTARIGAGVRWQQVIDAAAPYGLAPLCGSSTTVGAVGFLSGGGIGPLVRAFGASSDHVRSMTVVTGRGEVLRATSVDNPELFWGLRGGKSTLGIISEVVVDLEPLAELHGGALYFDGADAARVIRGWRDQVATLPNEVGTSVALLGLPPLPGGPPMLAGRLTVALRYAGIGDSIDHVGIVDGLRGLGDPLLDGIGPMPYAAIGAIHADPQEPMPTTECAELLGELPDDAIDALLAAAGPESGSVLTIVELRHLGGVFAEEPSVRSSLCHRQAAWTFLTVGVLAPPVAEQVMADGARAVTALARWTTGGRLPNFAASTSPDDIRRCYDEDTVSWLSALAEQLDPQGVLRVGQVVRR